MRGKSLGSPLDKMKPIFQKLKPLNSGAPSFFSREGEEGSDQICFHCCLPLPPHLSLPLNQGAAKAP